MWLSQTSASGMIPYFHFVGAETGRGEDTRWQKTGAEYFDWTTRHDAHLRTVRSIANIGVVIGQSTQLLYPGPKTAPSRSYMHETTQGIYETLLRGRFAFDFLHEDRLEPDRLAKYRALILPNVAMLSDHQSDQLRAYAKAGGSLMASFETGLYDENLEPRADFALADLFGVGKAGEAIGTNGNPYYARIAEGHTTHAIVGGFAGTNWLPGAQNRVPLKPVSNPVLTVVPGFVRYPPELAYPPLSHTDEPAIVLRASGQSRTAWLAGDVERTYWITGHGDLLRFLHNTIRWVTHDEIPVRVEGEGFLEMFCWETRPGYAVHLLNYSNPNAFHPWHQAVHKIGEQRVFMKLPAGVGVKSVELLRAEQTIPHRFEDGVLQFVIPSIGDYEVAAVTAT